MGRKANIKRIRWQNREDQKAMYEHLQEILNTEIPNQALPQNPTEKFFIDPTVPQNTPSGVLLLLAGWGSAPGIPEGKGNNNLPAIGTTHQLLSNNIVPVVTNHAVPNWVNKKPNPTKSQKLKKSTKPLSEVTEITEQQKPPNQDEQLSSHPTANDEPSIDRAKRSVDNRDPYLVIAHKVDNNNIYVMITDKPKIVLLIRDKFDAVSIKKYISASTIKINVLDISYLQNTQEQAALAEELIDTVGVIFMAGERPYHDLYPRLTSISDKEITITPTTTHKNSKYTAGDDHTITGGISTHTEGETNPESHSFSKKIALRYTIGKVSTSIAGFFCWLTTAITCGIVYEFCCTKKGKNSDDIPMVTMTPDTPIENGTQAVRKLMVFSRKPPQEPLQLLENIPSISDEHNLHVPPSIRRPLPAISETQLVGDNPYDDIRDSKMSSVPSEVTIRTTVHSEVQTIRTTVYMPECPRVDHATYVNVPVPISECPRGDQAIYVPMLGGLSYNNVEGDYVMQE